MPTTQSFAIETENLGRVYKVRGTRREKKEHKEQVALSDVNLSVRPGEFFGLLGPNGAGKTTLIKILVTLLAPTAGRAVVAGFDVAKDPHSVRPRINMVSGGESSGYGLLTVRENLWMFAQFYGIDYRTTRKRIDELLEIVGLKDRANTKTSDLSTGMRQKMNIVRGFLTDPEVIFLDEPTLGLDVRASRDVRQFIRSWAAGSRERTMLLTTHYMAEADELCDRVAIINAGKVLACDSPSSLKRGLQRDAIFHLEVSPPTQEFPSFDSLHGVRKVVHTPKDGTYELELILEEDDAIGGVINTLTAHHIRILNLQKREPTLEDVFLDLVGMSLLQAEKTE